MWILKIIFETQICISTFFLTRVSTVPILSDKKLIQKTMWCLRETKLQQSDIQKVMSCHRSITYGKLMNIQLIMKLKAMKRKQAMKNGQIWISHGTRAQIQRIHISSCEIIKKARFCLVNRYTIITGQGATASYYYTMDSYLSRTVLIRSVFAFYYPRLSKTNRLQISNRTSTQMTLQ